MARKKQRTFHHIMEDESYAIIKKHLPKEWVVRGFDSPISFSYTAPKPCSSTLSQN